MPRDRGTRDGGNPSLRTAEASLHVMDQISQYFTVGMDHVLEVATDMSDYDLGEAGAAQAKRLQDIMMSYVQMERDMEIFTTAAKDVINQVGDGAEDGEEEEGGLARRLQAKVKDGSRGRSNTQLRSHPMVTELEAKLTVNSQPDTAPGGSLGRPASHVEEDIEMTQESVVTRCPYTGTEMTDPLRNKICKHAYEREGILDYIRRKGKKAKCPVGGCNNNKPLVMSDLVEDKELKKFIQAKNRKRT